MRELLKGYVLAQRDLAQEAGVRAVLVGDAEAVAELCARFVELGEALDDRAAPVQQRQAVLADLVGERVHPITMRTLNAVVAMEVPGEVAHSIEELPAVLGIEETIEAPGDYATPRRVEGYALGVLEDLEDREELEPVLRELRGVAELVESNRELERLLSGFIGTREARRAVVDDVIAPRVSVRTAWIVRAAVGTSAVRPAERTFERLVALAAHMLERSMAVVRTARSLPDDKVHAVQERLEAVAGRRLEVEWIVDEGVIGGVVAIVGDRLWDMSVRRHLEGARRLVRA